MHELLKDSNKRPGSISLTPKAVIDHHNNNGRMWKILRTPKIQKYKNTKIQKEATPLVS